MGVRGSVRSSSSDAFAEERAACGGEADPGAVSGAVPRLERTALFRDGVPWPRGEGLLHVREAGASRGGAGAQAQGAGAAPAAPRAAGLVLREAAHRREQARSAGGGGGWGGERLFGGV